jgi:hypothetical protein
MQRAKIDMTPEVFSRTLEWVQYFDARGTQKELSLTGIGEALLHPLFRQYVEQIRQVYQGYLLFSTNGLLINDEIAPFLAKHNVHTYVSLHRQEVAGPALNALMRAKATLQINAGFALSSFNWGGTLDWPVTAKPHPCSYLGIGWGTVMSDGSMTTCCMDSEGTGIVGHVNDPIGSLSLKPYDLCSKCHLTVPEA